MPTNIDSIKSYLTRTCELMDKCQSAAIHTIDYVYLKEGRAFSNSPLSPDEEKELLAHFTHKKYQRGYCWMNAAMISLGSKTLKFCEGYAVHDRLPIPIHHAWVEFKGRAIDVTWGKDLTARGHKAIIERIRRNLSESSYYGVDIPKAELTECLLKTERYGSVVEYRQRKKFRSINSSNTPILPLA